MIIDQKGDRWYIDAPWLDVPVEGDTFEEVYFLALLVQARAAKSS